MAQKQPTFLQRLRSKGPKPRRRTDGFYHTTRWRKLRRYVLAREPLCRDPFGEHAEWSEVVSATEVDRQPALHLARGEELGLVHHGRPRRGGRNQQR